MKEAFLWEDAGEGAVTCNLCEHRCTIKPDKIGICSVRFNTDGKLVTAVDDTICAAHVDPIEKKPFFHYQPGTRSFSIATVGCNLRCKHCQNWQISQYPKDKAHRGEIYGEKATPKEIVEAAARTGSSSIAYTYTEPTIFIELAYDTMKIAHDAGIKNLFVTSGYMTPEALELIEPVLDAANVDLKGFDEKRYMKQNGCHLEPVKNNIIALYEMGKWVEVTTLIIPGHNDDPDELKALAEWLVGIDPNIPWHVTAFHPDYKTLDIERTRPQTLRIAHDIGKQAGLNFVYSGNVPGDEYEDTYCPGCGMKLIDRWGHGVEFNKIAGGACPECTTVIPGVEMDGPESQPSVIESEARHRVA